MATMATTNSPGDTVEEYRVSMVEELGFTKAQAKKLVEARRTIRIDSKGFERRYEHRLDWHYIKGLLEAGATRQQVLDIFL